VNPTLTIIANALRVGDHLLERLGVPTSASEFSFEMKPNVTKTITPEMAAIA